MFERKKGKEKQKEKLVVWKVVKGLFLFLFWGFCGVIVFCLVSFCFDFFCLFFFSPLHPEKGSPPSLFIFFYFIFILFYFILFYFFVCFPKSDQMGDSSLLVSPSSEQIEKYRPVVKLWFRRRR